MFDHGRTRKSDCTNDQHERSVCNFQPCAPADSGSAAITSCNMPTFRTGGWPRLDAHCAAVILIGRRMAYSDEEQERMASFRGENIEVESYDRVLENIEQRVETEMEKRKNIKELVKRTKRK